MEKKKAQILYGKHRHLKGILFASLATAVLAAADASLSSEVSFSIFYLIPVSIATLMSGELLGILFSVLCSFLWLFIDLRTGMHYSSTGIMIWNTSVRFGYFMFHTRLLSWLLSANGRLRESAMHDPLTRAANWRYFEAYANTLMRQLRRDGKKLALAYIDVDDFKAINDTLGHDTGDQVLTALAKSIQGQIRPTDLLARLGGDEFALLLVNTEADSAREILDRILDELKEAFSARGWNVSVSMGAKLFAELPPDVGRMLKDVDSLMYEKKKNGKNGYLFVAEGDPERA